MSNNSVETANRNIWKKGLLVDDELKSPTSQKNLLNNLNIPSEYILFAADYESALQIVKNNSDIQTCIIDVRIPKNSQASYDYKEDDHPDWGISLVPQINKLNKQAEIQIYSAQVQGNYIRERIDEFNNVKGFYGKDDQKNKRNDMITRLLRQSSFDYSALNKTDANFVRAETIKIRDCYNSMVDKILEIGESLIEIKGKLKHGLFHLWLETEFEMNSKTAQRYMNVAKTFKLNRENNLDTQVTQRFVPTALFALAEPSVSDAARDEAIKKAIDGEKISVKLAFELKAKHNPKKKTTRKKIEELKPVEKIEEIEFSTKEPEVLPSEDSKQQIVKLIRQENLWQLDQHLLFCGDPNSTEFLSHLPSKINLNLAFPADRSWLFSYPHKIESCVTFSSIYQEDLEPSFFETSIAEVINFTTDANNVAAICFCPNPAILRVAHSLGLRCFIAEPDRSKCQLILTYWKQLSSKK